MPCCCNSSLRCVILWIGASLFHAVLLAGIGVAAWKIWPFGLTLSLLYTASLWGCLERKYRKLGDEAATQRESPPRVGTTSVDSKPGLFLPPFYMTLLYAIAALSAGLPGGILTFGALPCLTRRTYDE